jgi:hypothetical protein
MLLEAKNISDIAEKLNITTDDLLHDSVKIFLERKLRELKTDIFKITSKYGVLSVEELEGKYKKGELEEKDSWQDFQLLDHLEFKRDEVEKILRGL